MGIGRGEIDMPHQGLRAQTSSWVDRLGGPDAYNHFPTGWAAAFSTPFKMFKRYSEYSGGTCDPLIVSWPKGMKTRGEVRHQYHRVTDIVPTILDACGPEMPDTYRGVEQYPLSGVSMRYSFDADPDGPTQKKHQYYEMFGTRGISRFGGHSLFVQDKKLYYVYNFLGILPEQKFVSSEELTPGKCTRSREVFPAVCMPPCT